ncbi:MAG TPA: hypothetical protein VGP62_13235 [Bryobacteraceae bacterium]|nr:hypothetical protein [Bryobacteraceae bacterium]
MTILEQAEQLRQQAITILLQERDTIDQKLGQLGHDGTPREAKRSCSICGAADHNARRCSKKKAPENIED